MIKIPLSSKFKKKNKFDIRDYNKPFFLNEVKGYKLVRYPKLKNKSFWQSSPKHLKKRILIISGPGRSGNHLLNALLNGNKSLANVVGEDAFFSSILLEANRSEKGVIKKVKSGDINFYLKLSQFGKKFEPIDKWLKVFKVFNLLKKKNSRQKQKLINTRKFQPSGNQPGKSTYILDYRGFAPDLNYSGFKNFFLKNKDKFNNIKNIFDFIFLYFEASNILMRSDKIKPYFKNIMFHSGLRKESNFLLNHHKNTILLCPIRQFDGMLLSFLKARHDLKFDDDLKKKEVLLYWEMWKHKIIDYLILQKKFPKRVFLISYENLTNYPQTSIKKIFKKLKIRFNNINKFPTIQNRPVSGNSSFNVKHHSKLGKVYKNYIKGQYNLSHKLKLSDEYFEILKYINKKIINK